MSESGCIFRHEQGGFNLTVLDRNWAIAKSDTCEVIAKAFDMPDYAAAKQCALMCARIYVPDFYMLDPNDAFAKFREELLESTNLNEPEFKEWLRGRHQEVVNAFLTTIDPEAKCKYKLEELLAFGRRQFARYTGKGA